MTCFKQKKTYLIDKYKYYLNKFTKLKLIAKKNYCKHELDKCENEIAKQWKVINEIISRKKCQNKSITAMVDSQGCTVTEKKLYVSC